LSELRSNGPTFASLGRTRCGARLRELFASQNGEGLTSSVIQALEFVVGNKDRPGIRVVNLSLGHPIYESAATDPLVQAVERAVRAGLVVVVAAGNFGTTPTTGLTGFGGIASPGNAPTAGGLQTCLTPIPSSPWHARRSTGGATVEAGAEGAAFRRRPAIEC
jgi:serine protease AprX